MSSYPHDNYPPASLFKQMAAMVYDSFLISAILFVVVGITVPFNQGGTINPTLVYLFLTIVIFVFYGWFWNRSGQTLGMQAWKIQVVSEFGGYPGWAISGLRLIFASLSLACFGVGYWWRLFKPYTWHDRLSQTKVIDISAPEADQVSTGSS